jgi:hypothetical protein
MIVDWRLKSGSGDGKVFNQQSEINNHQFCSLYPPLNRPPDESVRGYVFAVRCTTASTADTLLLISWRTAFDVGGSFLR